MVWITPLVLLGVATPGLAAQVERPLLSKACPNLTLKQVRAIESYKGKFQENAFYARSYCVPIEEAERRMELQNRGAIGPKQEPGPAPAPPADTIGAINARLQTEEAGTFAGLWIDNGPTYRVMVAFTRDAAATLARYTRDPLFVPLDRPGPSLAQLRAEQQRLIEEFQKRGFRWSMAGASETTGRIEFQLAQDAAPIRAAAARGEFVLPAFVDLREPRPFPHAAPPMPAGKDVRVTVFPQLKHRTDMYPQTLVGVPDVPATLELRSGCLVLVTDADARVALWGQEVSLDLTDPARVGIFDRLSGIGVKVGDRISLNGLQPGTAASVDQAEKVGTSAACPGPYRLVSGFRLQAVVDGERRESRIQELMRSKGLGLAAATRTYAAERARLKELQALRTRLLAEAGDRIGAMGVNEVDATAHLFLTPGTTIAMLVPAHLRVHVTSQTVPRGHRELEGARAALQRQLAAAAVPARLSIEEIGGNVIVQTDDSRALSAAAVAGKLSFPAFVQLALPGAAPIGGWGNGLRLDDLQQRYEQQPGFTTLREMIARTPLPSYTDPNTGERPIALPSRARSLDMAHWLAAFGFGDPARVSKLRREGIDVIITWADSMTGPTTVRHRLIMAENLVIAEPVAIDTKAPGKDGHRSTINWRIVETLKGAARPGTILQQRLQGGEDETGQMLSGTDEPILLPGLPGSVEPGRHYFLSLSNASYKHSALLIGGDGAAQDGMTIGTVAPITGNRVQPFPDLPGVVSLESLRSQVAPIQRAFRAAGA